MTMQFWLGGVLAAGNPFELMRDHLSRPTSIWEFSAVLLFLAAAAGVWALLWLLEQHRGHAEAPPVVDTRTMLQQLGDAHQLSPEELAQIQAVAKERNLSDAGLLFVDPRLWEQMAAEQNSSRSEWARRLGSRLFGNDFHDATAR